MTVMCQTPRYEEKLKERLARKRERLAQGLPPEDDEEEDEEMEGDQLAATDVLAVLDNLGDRFVTAREARPLCVSSHELMRATRVHMSRGALVFTLIRC